MAAAVWIIVAVVVLGALAYANYRTRARMSTDRAAQLAPGRYFAPGTGGGDPGPGWEAPTEGPMSEE